MTPTADYGALLRGGPCGSGDRLARVFRIGRVGGRLDAREGSYDLMAPATLAEPRRHFADDNATLAGWFGRDLSTWGAM